MNCNQRLFLDPAIVLATSTSWKTHPEPTHTSPQVKLIAFYKEYICNSYIFLTANCELLAVFNKNYKVVLQPHMQKLWQEKKSALRALDYFNFLNEEQVSALLKAWSIL